MGRYDDFFCRDCTMSSDSCAGRQFSDTGAFIEFEPRNNPRRKFQRVKLCLIRKSYRPSRRDGQRRLFLKICPISDPAEAFKLLFQLFPVGQRIYICVPVPASHSRLPDKCGGIRQAPPDLLSDTSVSVPDQIVFQAFGIPNRAGQ